MVKRTKTRQENFLSLPQPRASDHLGHPYRRQSYAHDIRQVFRVPYKTATTYNLAVMKTTQINLVRSVWKKAKTTNPFPRRKCP